MDEINSGKLQDYSEQLNRWNDEIEKKMRNVNILADSIRALPHQISYCPNYPSNKSDVETSALRILDRLPFIDEDFRLKQFYRPVYFNPVKTPLDNGSLYVSANGWFPSLISCIKIDSKEGKTLFVAGNAFLFICTIDDSSPKETWISTSQSAPNFVLDFDYFQQNVCLVMEDGFIRIFSRKKSAIVAEFPSAIESPILIRFANEGNTIILANKAGDICILKDNNSPTIVNVDFEPVNIIINGNKATLYGTHLVDLDLTTFNITESNEIIQSKEIEAEIFDGKVLVSKGGSTVEIEQIESAATCVALSPNGRIISIGCDNGMIYTYRYMCDESRPESTA